MRTEARELLSTQVSDHELKADVGAHALVVQWSEWKAGKTTYHRQQFSQGDIGAALTLYETCTGSKQLFAQYVRLSDKSAAYEWCTVLSNEEI